MAKLGFGEFSVVGHDRGGRVAHRMALDHPERVKKLAVLDIVPTYKMFTSVEKELATANYHWFFLIQPAPLPEKLIGADPDFWVRTKLERWAAAGATFDPQAVAEYLHCFHDPAVIHATCEDYRAAASIDLAHDEADLDKKVTCPVLALWGSAGRIHRLFDVVEAWQERARDVRGKPVACGHFLAEEAPDETYAELRAFLRDVRAIGCGPGSGGAAPCQSRFSLRWIVQGLPDRRASGR
jgi:haloacetate dehalogenase